MLMTLASPSRQPTTAPAFTPVVDGCARRSMRSISDQASGSTRGRLQMSADSCLSSRPARSTGPAKPSVTPKLVRTRRWFPGWISGATTDASAESVAVGVRTAESGRAASAASSSSVWGSNMRQGPLGSTAAPWTPSAHRHRSFVARALVA